MGGRVIGYAAVGVLLVGGALGYWMYYQNQIEAETRSIVGDATTPLQVARFVQDAHRDCSSDEAHRRAILTVTDAAAVSDACRSWIGRAFSIENCLASGLEFVGAGESTVPPESARSAHLHFRTPESDGEPRYVSLFIQVYRPNGTELPLQDGVVYTLKSAGGDVPMIAWRTGGLVHYLVSESPEQAGRMREAMKVAEPTQTL